MRLDYIQKCDNTIAFYVHSMESPGKHSRAVSIRLMPLERLLGNSWFLRGKNRPPTGGAVQIENPPNQDNF